MSELEKIKAHLIALAEGAMPECPNQGLCCELYEQFGLRFDRAGQLIKHWPEALPGLYPIEGNGWAYQKNRKKWGATRHGNARRRLCRWMVENINQTDLGPWWWLQDLWRTVRGRVRKWIS